MVSIAIDVAKRNETYLSQKQQNSRATLSSEDQQMHANARKCSDQSLTAGGGVGDQSLTRECRPKSSKRASDQSLSSALRERNREGRERTNDPANELKGSISVNKKKRYIKLTEVGVDGQRARRGDNDEEEWWWW